MNRSARRTFVVIAIVVVASLTASAASAATWGHTGQALEGGTLCYDSTSRIIVRPPYVASSPIVDWSRATTFYAGGAYGGGWHAQRVSYQAFLYRWNGYGWAYTGRAGSIYTGWTYDALQPVVWNNMDLGGSTVFASPGKGYFKVRFQVTWYADALTPGGGWDAFGTQYEYLGGTAASYCHYA